MTADTCNCRNGESTRIAANQALIKRMDFARLVREDSQFRLSGCFSAIQNVRQADDGQRPSNVRFSELLESD